VRWVEEAEAAEVVDNKGKLWLTTNVTGAGESYSNVEEIEYTTCLMKCWSCAAAIQFIECCIA
jgi:hypothetical protein